MNTIALAPITGSDRKPDTSTALVDHWARLKRKARAPRMHGNATVDHWASRAPITPTLTALAMAREATSTAQQLPDPWIGLNRAHARVMAQEQSVAQALRAGWERWRERRALAGLEARIRAMAAGDERVLRELMIACDVAQWRHLPG